MPPAATFPMSRSGSSTARNKNIPTEIKNGMPHIWRHPIFRDCQKTSLHCHATEQRGIIKGAKAPLNNSIISFLNFMKFKKLVSACQRDFFDKLKKWDAAYLAASHFSSVFLKKIYHRSQDLLHAFMLFPQGRSFQATAWLRRRRRGGLRRRRGS